MEGMFAGGDSIACMNIPIMGNLASKMKHAVADDAAGGDETIDSDAGDGFDFASIIPEKGDPRRPPEWFSRAIVYVGVGVIAFMFALDSWNRIRWLAVDVAVCVFLALAMEPAIGKMTRHGMKRTTASMLTWGSVIIMACVLVYLFGAMFVEQITGLVKSIPATYDGISGFISQRFGVDMPALPALGGRLAASVKTDWLTDIAGKTFGLVGGIGSFAISLMIVILTTYYIAAYSDRIRKGICGFIRPSGQRRFLKAWGIIQTQVSSFLYSRIILAVINAACLAVFMVALKVPYWLPLSLFCGLVSQFIPTIGTYIGGALPVLSALGSNGIKIALFILAYIIVYQQIENLLLSPMISQKTMDLNPAVALLAVFLFGSMFGALGAFLALPIAASMKAMLAMYATRHDVIESELIERTGEIPTIIDSHDGAEPPAMGIGDADNDASICDSSNADNDGDAGRNASNDEREKPEAR